MQESWPRHETIAPSTRGAIRPGDEIEVWCRSLRRWSSGFEALRREADGWRVRRRSDRYELPIGFPGREIRLARR